MPQEVRTLAEGTLRWVQAGAAATTGVTGWVTASAPASGLFGYVQAGMTFSRTETFVGIHDRGVPKHFKHTKTEIGKGNFKLLYGITADYPATALTASGWSVPMVHLEWRANYTENGTASGIYWQLHNVVIDTPKLTEAENGDDATYDFQFISWNGPTASGYLG
jgi:hypothetical protein